MAEKENNIEKIFSLIQKERDDDQMQSELLEHYYTNATIEEKHKMDSIVV